jgi:predicted nucleic acid-binding protein
MILLDMCVVSELVRPAPDPRVLAWFETAPEDGLYLSVLTLGELQRGADLLDDAALPMGARGPSGSASQPARRARVQAWVDGLARTFADRLLPVDDTVAVRWGRLTAQARRAGRTRPAVDSLLAATALRHDLTLATRNLADFEGTGVRLVNPWEA